MRDPAQAAVTVGAGLAVRAQVDDMDVTERRRVRPDDRDPDAAVRAPDGVPSRQVVAPVREPLHCAVVEGDPPQLVAAADRRAEQEMPAVGRRPEVGGLAGRDVAAHPRARHQVVAAGKVAALALPGLAAVRGEQPDVVAAPPGPRVAVAQHGHGPSIGQPGRRPERRAGSVRDPDIAAVRDIHHVHVELPAEVRVAPALGDIGDARAVR